MAAASNHYALRRTNSWLDGTADSPGVADLATPRDTEHARVGVFAAQPATPKVSAAGRLRAEMLSEGQDPEPSATAQPSPKARGGAKILAWFMLMLRQGNGFR